MLCPARVCDVYIDSQASTSGRGEAVRIAMFASGIKHTDKFLLFSEYQEVKSTSQDWAWKNGLPVLGVDGKEFTQSLAQLRYAGKKAGLYPTADVDALAVDEILDITQDILTRSPSDSDENVKLKKRAEYAAPGGKMHSLVSLLEQRATETDSPWMVGQEMSVADLAVYFSVLKMLRDGDFDGVLADYVVAFPNWAALEKALPEHDVIKAWYATKH